MSIALRTILAALIFATLFTASARADDQEQIKASAKAFAGAMSKGDIPTAKKYAITDENTGKLLDAVGEMFHAREKLIAAATAKFGEEGKSIVPGKSFGAAPDFAGKIDSAQIDVAGDTATVTSKEHPEKPVKFKKQDGQWKLDMTSLPDIDKIADGLPKIAALNTAMNDTAGEISDGKYMTVQEAKKGLFQKIILAFRPSAPAK